jgi:hypothetical protein
MHPRQWFRQTIPAWKFAQHHGRAVQFAWVIGFELRNVQRRQSGQTDTILRSLWALSGTASVIGILDHRPPSGCSSRLSSGVGDTQLRPGFRISAGVLARTSVIIAEMAQTAAISPDTKMMRLRQIQQLTAPAWQSAIYV